MASPAGKDLTYCLSCVLCFCYVVFSCVFVTFPIGVPGQVWYLIDHLLIFAFLSTFMLSFSDNNQADFIEALTSTSGHPGDLLKIDSPYY